MKKYFLYEKYIENTFVFISFMWLVENNLTYITHIKNVLRIHVKYKMTQNIKFDTYFIN